MTLPPTAAIVLAAGMGTRMKSARPKVMHAVGGRPLVNHVVETLKAVNITKVVVVVGPGMDDVKAAVAPHTTVEQTERLGTGHAVLQAKAALKHFEGDIIIAYGDTPFVSAEAYMRLQTARAEVNGPKIVVMGFLPENPTGYGRLLIGPKGLERIVEEKDATPEEKRVRVCNSGIFAVEAATLWAMLAKVDKNNAKGEYYLTDIVTHARAADILCGVVHGEEDELLGINSRNDLASAEALFQNQMRRRALDGGATLLDPATTYFSADTVIGQDVEIGPHVMFGPGVTVENNVTIKGYCHIEGAKIRSGAQVGPFTRLRPGAVIGVDAHIGNFVEVKNASIEKGAKVNHLTYIGDARVGAGANVGAGVITANYDGFNKSHTDIGAGAAIGSNSVLVAPVKIGDGAITGAGAVVRKDVPANALVLNDSNQKVVEGFALKYRAQKKAQKEKAQKEKAKK
ncbi:MAG: bifunctional UDP-N-acetylglucosamine diphosphorylase/glucosamine-1-phosphate N-acetyltransferase GlmU [Rhodospirillaceae bacterium]|nr:bifunctional UDP-N-acetylglucosamine diphosphorylase/glucosamine-1-phosphate N-acetyltransferase GlmU [Rhodospirillaceae bacterium]